MARQEIVTLKVDAGLAQALRAMPNRSDFIRRAMLKELDNACPLCQGSGVLSVAQRRHWNRFARRHPLVHCGACDAYHLVCRRGRRPVDGTCGKRAMASSPPTT